ncbi:MAG: hypothetical protein AB4058_03345 [Microcystaceae cyanobacterium]
MQKQSLLATIGLLGCLSFSSLQALSQNADSINPEWQEFNILPNQITIKMPIPPQKRIKTVSQGDNSHQYTSHAALHNDTSYSVAYGTFPMYEAILASGQSFTPSVKLQLLSEILEVVVDDYFIDGEILTQKPVTKQEATCLESTMMGQPSARLKQESEAEGFPLQDQTVYLKDIICLDSQSFIEATVMSHSLEEMKRSSGYFIDSLSLK